MIPTLTALLQTLTGKAILGLTVATASVGAAAAGAPVPIVQELVPGAEHAAVSEDRPADLPSGDLTESKDGSEPVEPATAPVGAAEAIEDDDAEEGTVEEGAADEPNHGDVVSEFATTTELEGCERGQAVSAVARGELDPGSDTFDADLTTYLDDLDKCNDTDDEADDEAEAAETAEEGAADEPNHGQVVSEFATTTELEGCERGQAVSAVARGELDPGSDTFDADLTTHLDELDKCNDTDDEADEDADDEADETVEQATEKPAENGARPPADKPNGKSEERGNRPDHAGGGKP